MRIEGGGSMTSGRRFLSALVAALSLFSSRSASADIVHQRSVEAKVAADAQQVAIDKLQAEVNAAKSAAWDKAIKALTPAAVGSVDATKQAAVRADINARDMAKLKVRADALAAVKLAPFAETPETAELCGVQTAATLPACQAMVAGAVSELSTSLQAADASLAKPTAELERRQTALKEALAFEAEASSVRPGTRFSDAMAGARRVRCYTAYCWGGDGTQYGVEPILDLPIGISWASGNGGLANYINSNRVDVSVSAGLRYWFAYDVMSVGILLARPSLSNSSNIEIEQSEVVFTSAAVSRPFPTLVVGFWGDIFSVTFSYDQLRNTDGAKAADPKFLPNEVLSRTFVVGLSINPFTAARNAIGASKAAPQGSSGQP